MDSISLEDALSSATVPFTALLGSADDVASLSTLSAGLAPILTSTGATGEIVMGAVVAVLEAPEVPGS